MDTQNPVNPQATVQPQGVPTQPQPQVAPNPQYVQQQGYAPAPPPLFLTEVGKLYVNSTAKWARIVGIIGIIALVLLLIIFIVLIVTTNKALHSNYYYSEYYSVRSSASSGITIMLIIMYLVSVGLSIYPISSLLGFKKKVDAAIASNDSNMLALAFNKISGYFKYVGVLSIISLVLMFIYTVIVVFAAGEVSHYL